MTYTAWFDEIGKDDIALAGGTGSPARLSSPRLAPLPPGFVITTAAYDAFVESNDIGDSIVGRASVARAEDPAGTDGKRWLPEADSHVDFEGRLPSVSNDPGEREEDIAPDHAPVMATFNL